MNGADWPLKQEPEFAEIWAQVAPYTMASPQRGYALWQSINHVIEQDVPGVFVECGVWRGGSAMLMALTLMSRNAKRKIILFDTFDGMSSSAEVDTDINGYSTSELSDGHHSEQMDDLVANRVGLPEVQEAMGSTGYDPRMVYYVQGDVRFTLPKTQTFDVSLLRLGTDSYDSTFAELNHLYPRVSQGGVVIIDSFENWCGARKAFSDYFEGPHNARSIPLLWSLDYTGRGFVKADLCCKTEVERYDYIPPGFCDPDLLELFLFAEPTTPWAVKWPHLRPSVPHIFRNDIRNSLGFAIGNASYEEAVCLYTIALQFSGKRGLEIGSHFGWTSAHLRASGLDLDLMDPAFSDPQRISDVSEVLDGVKSEAPYRIWPLTSPDGLRTVSLARPEPWSFVFIDGDHDGEAPANDARSVLEYCADDAVIVFHDMTSPDVSKGLAVCHNAGWNVEIYNTMQVLGIAWRGNVSIPKHIKDPSVPHLFFGHLNRFNIDPN